MVPVTHNEVPPQKNERNRKTSPKKIGVELLLLEDDPFPIGFLPIFRGKLAVKLQECNSSKALHIMKTLLDAPVSPQQDPSLSNYPVSIEASKIPLEK